MICIKEYSSAAIFFHLSAMPPDPVPLKTYSRNTPTLFFGYTKIIYYRTT
jgi:hypothetical protein